MIEIQVRNKPTLIAQNHNTTIDAKMQQLLSKKQQTDILLRYRNASLAQIHGLHRSHIKSRTQDRLTGTSVRVTVVMVILLMLKKYPSITPSKHDQRTSDVLRIVPDTYCSVIFAGVGRGVTGRECMDVSVRERLHGSHPGEFRP